MPRRLQPPSVSVSRPGSADPGGDPLRTVVWIGGDHDIASQVTLTASIARAARLDDSDVVVDLSGVTFMDASTIGAIVASHNELRVRSHALSVRSPTPRTQRLLTICELDFLLDLAQPTGLPVPSATGIRR